MDVGRLDTGRWTVEKRNGRQISRSAQDKAMRVQRNPGGEDSYFGRDESQK